MTMPKILDDPGSSTKVVHGVVRQRTPLITHTQAFMPNDNITLVPQQKSTTAKSSHRKLMMDWYIYI